MADRDIPQRLAERIPLMKKKWLSIYNRMGEHPDSPRWNTECGDRLFEDDLNFVKNFESELIDSRSKYGTTPPESIVRWCRFMAEKSWWFESALSDIDPEREWNRIPLMTRRDMQAKPELIVPHGADLSRLVVNPTSGTTGHPIAAPNHPAAVGCYDPMIQYALKMNGLKSSCSGERVAAIQVCSQQKTIVYHTVHSYLDGAGFAKINLNSKEWRSPGSAAVYVRDMEPVFLSGDPYSFLDYIRRGIEYRPQIVLSTAIALEKTLRDKITSYFRCQVTDLYSLNETGPIAYSCPDDPSKFHILPHDIFVEAVTESGEPVSEGDLGLIAVTGGRNPYLPLLRYLTGDTGAMSCGRCSCGESSPAIKNLTGRGLVLFSKIDGGTVNSIDVSGIIRSFPVYSFSFLQRSGLSCELRIDSGGEMTVGMIERMRSMLGDLFGTGIVIDISREKLSTGEKVIPFISEAGHKF